MVKENTKKSFKDKWENNPDLAFSETLRKDSDIFKWILGRNGFDDEEVFRKYLSKKNKILDAGCGNGRVTNLISKYTSSDVKIVAIDLVSAQIAKDNLKELSNVVVYEKDILGDLSDLGKFDFIYCQEVIHHTNNPKFAFNNLCNLLEEGGEIAIYVYKKKAPIREYTDDYVREKISSLPYEDAMKISKVFTEFGKNLSNLNIKVDVPDIDILEIKGGRYDIQRLIYHFFMKCFYNPELSDNENAAINYDWYHPTLSSRHTCQEVLGWVEDCGGLSLTHKCVDHYGITIRAKKC